MLTSLLHSHRATDAERSGDLTLALHHHTEALGILRTLGAWHEAEVRIRRGWLHHTLTNFDAARADFEQALRLARDMDAATALAHAGLGLLAWEQDGPRAAVPHFRAAVATGATDMSAPEVKAHLALALHLCNHRDEARILLPDRPIRGTLDALPEVWRAVMDHRDGETARAIDRLDAATDVLTARFGANTPAFTQVVRALFAGEPNRLPSAASELPPVVSHHLVRLAAALPRWL
jgi:tetratricopeptide (TPR) repeat protein